jgi:hypothetical protein
MSGDKCQRCHWFAAGYGEADPCYYHLRPITCQGPFKGPQAPDREIAARAKRARIMINVLGWLGTFAVWAAIGGWRGLGAALGMTLIAVAVQWESR